VVVGVVVLFRTTAVDTTAASGIVASSVGRGDGGQPRQDARRRPRKAVDGFMATDRG
jgi:hypothetical protein